MGYIYFLSFNFTGSLEMVSKLQNQKNLVPQLSKPGPASHAAVLRLLVPRRRSPRWHVHGALRDVRPCFPVNALALPSEDVGTGTWPPCTTLTTTEWSAPSQRCTTSSRHSQPPLAPVWRRPEARPMVTMCDFSGLGEREKIEEEDEDELDDDVARSVVKTMPRQHKTI